MFKNKADKLKVFTQKLEHASVYLIKKEQHADEVDAVITIAQPDSGGEKLKSGAEKNFEDIIIKSIEQSYHKDLEEPDLDKVKRSRTTKDHPDLKNYFRTNRYLIASYKETPYTAILLTSGQIKYKNETYKSPSGAAKAVKHKETNGWDFWHIEDFSGELIKLSELGLKGKK